MRTQIQKELEAATGLAMLAFSLVAGPVLSWVAGKIRYNLFPKYASSPQMRERLVFIAEKDSMWGKEHHLFEVDHDKVWAKVFGDLGKEVAGLGIDAALKVVTPDSSAAKNAIQSAAISNQVSFKTSLENAMLAEADLTIKAIMSVAMSINANSSYGAECLQKLKRLNPRLKNPKVSEDELEPMAKAMIRNDINKQRQEWADQWFYYGNDPGPSLGMADGIELELWGLWILNEKLKTKTKSVSGSMDSSIEVVTHYVEGATFGEYGVPEGVLRRLAEFGVVEARTELQKLRNIAAQIAKEQLVAERRRKEDEEATAAYRNAIEDAEGAEDPASERAYVTRQKYQADKEVQERRAQEKPDQPQPPISVGSKVDTQGEIEALESWAKHHPPMLGSGQMTHRKRTIGDIENVHR